MSELSFIAGTRPQLNIRETTNPATADCGMREFVIGLDVFTEITLIASVRDPSGSDEQQQLSDSPQLPTNEELTAALVQLASRTVADLKLARTLHSTPAQASTKS